MLDIISTYLDKTSFLVDKMSNPSDIISDFLSDVIPDLQVWYNHVGSALLSCHSMSCCPVKAQPVLSVLSCPSLSCPNVLSLSLSLSCYLSPVLSLSHVMWPVSSMSPTFALSCVFSLPHLNEMNHQVWATPIRTTCTKNPSELLTHPST